jgi:hypothetical protein
VEGYAMTRSTPQLQPSEVTLESLLERFQAAQVRCKPSPNGAFLIVGPFEADEAPISVMIDPSKHLLYLHILYALRENVSKSKKLNSINEFNDRLDLIRAIYKDPTTMVVDYQLAYYPSLNFETLMAVLQAIGRLSHLIVVIDDGEIIDAGDTVDSDS